MVTAIFCRFLILEMLVIRGLCSGCSRSHLQKYFCTSEFALKATLVKPEDSTEIYQMRVISLYKGNDKLNISENATLNVETQTDVRNIYGHEYIIFGRADYGNLIANKCFGVLPGILITPAQERGLQGDYESGCDCIDEIDDYRHDLYCEYDFAFLKRDEERCTWDGLLSYNRCKNAKDEARKFDKIAV